MARVRNDLKINNLKNTHPQKYYMKLICDALFYLGAGSCWYEESLMTKTQKFLYIIWSIISNLYVFGGILNEFLAYFRSDLTDIEKNDLLLMSLAHWSIGAKIIILYLQRNRIKMLFEGFLEYEREYSSLKMEKASVKKAFLYCLALVINVYSVLVLSTIYAVTTHIKEGIPIRTEVTFYPKNTTPSIPFNIFRVLMELHWYYLVTIMNLIDCMCICSLVFLGYKFKYVQIYFSGLRRKFLGNPEMKSLSILEEEFEKGVIVGIKLHQHALWCAKNVQYALGTIYSIQVTESLIILVICLIKVAAAAHSFTLILATSTCFFCIVLLTGAYMKAGGDITTEAELVSTFIFDSGWELNRARQSLRTLLVVAIVNSEVPVLMTAFGIIELSYSNFLSIMRLSYSFFAVMY